MKKRHLYLLPLALGLAAISGQGIAQDLKCEPAPSIDNKDCKGVPEAPAIHINLNTMRVTPKCAVAKEGTVIVFSLAPRDHLELNTVEILPKDPSDYWLRGKNDLINYLIIIKVPEVDDPKSADIPPTFHDFGIRAPRKCLDPRIKVEH